MLHWLSLQPRSQKRNISICKPPKFEEKWQKVEYLFHLNFFFVSTR